MKMILVPLADDVGGKGLLDTTFAIAGRFNAHDAQQLSRVNGMWQNVPARLLEGTAIRDLACR